ncbi:MAG: ATP-binding protein [Candidatus Nanohaloarchaea archaeon]|nr:ATP-binding protein [Candidatus Nanohaloarchaea archaeon]
MSTQETGKYEEPDTNLQILTGGTNSGKTTIKEELSRRGYRVAPESARNHIDQMLSRGWEKQEVYEDPEFQQKVLERDKNLEEAIPDDLTVFMDRSLADCAAYMRYFYDEDPQPVIQEVRGRYDNVFLLELLPFEEDYARREDEEEAIETHREIEKAYEEAGYDLIKIPPVSVEERADMIEEHLEDEKLEEGRMWDL